LAEIAARIGVPLGVARVLVADLLIAGTVAFAGRTALDHTDAEHSDLLRRVLRGLKKL
jgi:hypothetical protein